MAYWLLKTEPETFSWDDQVKRGAKGEPWSGVRNFTARRHLKEMKNEDRAFFYHTGDEKQIVGIVEVIRESYPDKTDPKGVFVSTLTEPGWWALTASRLAGTRDHDGKSHPLRQRSTLWVFVEDRPGK